MQKKNKFLLSKPTNPELDCGASNVSRSIKIISNRLLATERERNTVPCRMTLICFRFGMRKSNGGLAILRFEPKGLRSRLGSGLGEPPPPPGGEREQSTVPSEPRRQRGDRPWGMPAGGPGWGSTAMGAARGGRGMGRGPNPSHRAAGWTGGTLPDKEAHGDRREGLELAPNQLLGWIHPPSHPHTGGGTSPLGKALGGWPRGGQDPPPGFEDRLDRLGGAGLAVGVGGSDPALRKAGVGVHGRLYRFEVRWSKVGGGVPDPLGHVVLRDGGLWPRFPGGGGVALKL